MKIGVFGGAFNPVHMAHLITANEVAMRLNLDRVYFVVSARPPHKAHDTLIDFHHRLRMVELATESNENFYASGLEKERPGPSYAVDTMRYFRDRFGAGVHFIAGQDAVEDIGTWRSAATLLKTCNLVVVSRPGFDTSALVDVLQSVLSLKYKNIKLETMGISEDGIVETIHVVGGLSRIHVVKVTPVDISSTQIRERLRNGNSIKYLVPEPVEMYLREEGILKTSFVK